MDNLLNYLTIYLGKTPLLAYLAVFLGGILTSFTPCLYPIMPITISVIGSASGGSRSKAFFYSLIYVLGISTTYSILGIIASLSGKIFGQISTHPLTFFIVGNICILLGLSMLGVFNLPSLDFGQKARSEGRKRKGWLGIYLIGLAAGLVIGSCTTPVLGVILAYVATKQNVVFGLTLLFTFAVGMCLLLIIMGTFTGLLISLPQAGPWMKKIEKVFGLILIAVGEYFLILMGKMLI
jgi:thiol:disulfide interchange protein DsbD